MIKHSFLKANTTYKLLQEITQSTEHLGDYFTNMKNIINTNIIIFFKRYN